MDLPLFSSEDPAGWISRVQRYFNLNNLGDEEKLASVQICLEGAALRWLQYREQRKAFESWDELKDEILRRFGSGILRSPQEELLTLKQTGTVAEYRERFECLVAVAVELTDAWIQRVFMTGVQDEIQAEVRLFEPRDLDHLMRLDQVVEARNLANKGKNRAQTYFESSKTIYTNPNPCSGKRVESKGTTPQPPTPKIATNSLADQPNGKGNHPVEKDEGKRTKEFQKMSPAKYQEKFAKGLCFRCDEKFGPKHRCKSKQLRVLLVSDDENSGDELDYDEARLITGEDIIELSRHSVARIDSPKTMKLYGSMNGREVLVLVDGGATNNFIDQALIEELGISPGPKKFRVTIGNGNQVDGMGVFKQLTLTLPGIEITQDFLPFNLGNLDVIPGVEWLPTVWEKRHNWKTQVMKFEWEGKQISLKGDPMLLRLETSLRGF